MTDGDTATAVFSLGDYQVGPERAIAVKAIWNGDPASLTAGSTVSFWVNNFTPGILDWYLFAYNSSSQVHATFLSLGSVGAEGEKVFTLTQTFIDQLVAFGGQFAMRFVLIDSSAQAASADVTEMSASIS